VGQIEPSPLSQKIGGIYMLLSILLILKIILFMYITNIQYNRPIILLVSILISLFLFTLIYFSNLKKKQTWAFVFYNTVSIIMFADIMYYSFFNSLPSIKMLKQLNQVAAVGDSVAGLLSFRNLLFLLDIPFLMKYSKWKKGKIKEENKEYNKYIKWGVPLGIALVFTILFSYITNNDLLIPVSNQEIYTYHIRDIVETIKDEDMYTVEGSGVFTEEDLREIKERTKLKEGKLTGIGKGKNLIVIQVEALQNFPLNRFYNEQELTPNLNKLIDDKSTLYFNNYYQQIGRGNTSDAEFVSNNSLYPSMDEPTYSQYDENTFYGLPWVLRDNGYSSWVFHGYKKEFWNRERAYPKQGFERFVSEEDYDLNETIGFGITDEEFFKQSMKYLKEMESPFHAFMITLTSHTPFDMPEEYQALEIGEEYQGTILGDYLQAIHYADKAIGEFIEALKEEGLYDDSVIALYGDHFGITGLNDSGVELMTDFLGHPYDIDEMFKVPLIINVPGEDIKETISTIGSQMDFAPTILNIMGYENEKGLMFGRDLLNYDEYNYVAPQTYVLKGSFIDDEVMLFMSRDSIFENCTAKDKETREKVDVLPLRNKYESIIADINKSNYVLKTDLIGHLIENNGEVNLDQLGGLEIQNDNYIVECTENPIESLDNAYNEGYRLMSVGIQWRDDNRDIILQDGEYKRNITDIFSIEEYEEIVSQYDDNMPNIEDLINWMEKHQDAYIYLKTNTLDETVFLKVIKDYPEYKDRFIAEMKDFEQYILLSNKAYKNIILNLVDTKYSQEQIIDFLKSNHLFGTIIDEKIINTELPKKLKEMDIRVYTDEVGKKGKARKYVYGEVLR